MAWVLKIRKKIIFTILFLFIISSQIYANEKIDSLDELLDSNTDSEIIDIS